MDFSIFQSRAFGTESYLLTYHMEEIKILFGMSRLGGSLGKGPNNTCENRDSWAMSQAPPFKHGYLEYGESVIDWPW